MLTGGGTRPTIRFKGYNDNWHVDKGTNIFAQYYEKNHSELPVLSASQELGMVIRNEIGFNVQHNHQNEASYKRVKPGQFVIHLRSFQGGFAHSMVDGITSPAYTVMELKNPEEQNDIFWKYILSSKTFIKSLETVTYGIRDGRSIGFDDFGTLKQIYPNIKEQERIAFYLSQTDVHIKKNSDKLVKIKSMKQSFLQKMFA